MGIIDLLKVEVKRNKKRIILNEIEDVRILEAASIVLSEDLVDLILIGKKNDNINKYPILEKATFIDPEEFSEIDNYADKLYELRKEKGLSKEETKDLLLNNYMYLSCMLVLDNKADGVVSGISHSTADTLRPALQVIRGKESIVSSFFLMETRSIDIGDNGLLMFADCGLVEYPTAENLSIICKQTIDSYKNIVRQTPKVAFLSHSTLGSAEHENINKVRKAVALAKENTGAIIDGELQLDAALIPSVASRKCPNSPIEGNANILIFPDIDSGNIGYKLVELFGKAKAYGPITQGLRYPVNDLSRGSSIDDVVGVIIITALQAIKNMV